MARTSWTYFVGSFLALVAARGDGPQPPPARVTTEIQCFLDGTGLGAQIVSTRLLSPPEGMQPLFFSDACFLPGGGILAEGVKGELHRFSSSGAWEFRFEEAPGEAGLRLEGHLPWPEGCVTRRLRREAVEGRVACAVFSATNGAYLGESSFDGFAFAHVESMKARWMYLDQRLWIEDESGNELARISSRPDGTAFREISNASVGGDGVLVAVDAHPSPPTSCCGLPRETAAEPLERGEVVFEFSARGEALGQWRLPPDAESPYRVFSMARDIAIVWWEAKGKRLALLDRATGRIHEVPLPPEVARTTPIAVRALPFGGGLEWIGVYGNTPLRWYELAIPGT